MRKLGSHENNDNEAALTLVSTLEDHDARLVCEGTKGVTVWSLLNYVTVKCLTWRIRLPKLGSHSLKRESKLWRHVSRVAKKKNPIISGNKLRILGLFKGKKPNTQIFLFIPWNKSRKPCLSSGMNRFSFSFFGSVHVTEQPLRMTPSTDIDL